MFEAATYRARREALVHRLRGSGASGLALLAGAHDAVYTFGANPYPFRQDSTFLYYLGLSQPGLLAAIDLDEGTTTLAADSSSAEDRIWMEGIDAQALLQRCGADEVIGREAYTKWVASDRASGRQCHWTPSVRPDWPAELHGKFAAGGASRAMTLAIVAQREVKGEDELRQIEQAIAVSACMHAAARAATADGVTESEVVSVLLAETARQGARPAYPPICTRDGHVLHKLSYRNRLKRGDLLLIDAGAEASTGYASDITRTLCVDEAWSEVARLLYDTARAAQARAAQAACTGTPMAEVHRVAVRAIVEGLAPLRLFRGSVDAVIDSAAYALVFPHGVGHLLGLDVHDMEALGEGDVGYGDWGARDTRFGPNHLRLGKPLRQGMVITIEPGIYVIPALWQRWKAESTHADLIDYQALTRLAGVTGVRFEDVFVVEDRGAKRLGPPIAA